MDQSKSWWASKTIWASLVAFGCTLAGLFGVSVTGQEQAGLVEGLAGIGGLVSLVAAIYGRVTAKANIGGGSAKTGG